MEKINTFDDIKIRELTKDDLVPGLLEDFNRFQEVVYVLRTMVGKKVVIKDPFVENWDSKLKNDIVSHDFTDCFNNGGIVFLAFHNDKVIAFAALLHDFFGSQNQYLQLMQLHTSYEYRRLGLGKSLFRLCADKAKDWGAKKLYISGHSAVETQEFYEDIGCVDAKEINYEIAGHEPYDCQLEYLL